SREIPPVMVMGEAAGTAAALSLESGVTPRRVDVATLQKRLVAQGVNLGAPVAGGWGAPPPFVPSGPAGTPPYVPPDRPEVRNALHRAASDELDRVWTRFEDDPELRVAILTATGDKSFSAGYDMRDSSPDPSGAAYIAHRHPRGLGGLTLREGMSKPL